MADPGDDDNNENTETTASQQTSGSDGSSTNGDHISTPMPGQSMSKDPMLADNPLQGALHVSQAQLTLTTQSPITVSSQTRDRNVVVLCDNGRKLMLSDGRMIEAPSGQRFIIQTQKTPTATAQGQEQNSAGKAMSDGTSSTNAGQKIAANSRISNSVQETSTEVTSHFNQVNI